MSWQVLREVVEELDVSNYVDLFTEKFPRFEEAWEGLKWLLSRNPAPKGSARREAVSGGEYRSYVSASDPLAKTPEIWVVYTYTDDQVIILGVNAVEPRTED